jgi:hypothetical protein
MQVRRKRRLREQSKTALSGRFGRYKKEQEKAVREPDLMEDRCLSDLLEGWERFRGMAKEVDISTIYEDPIAMFYLASEVIRTSSVTKGHLIDFCLSLMDSEGHDMDDDNYNGPLGLFISAMTESSRKVTFLVPAHLFGGKLDLIGFKNTKILTIEGTVHSVGEGMIDGRIVVYGDANGTVGHRMSGGKITVEGNTKEIGFGTKGGEIHLKGELSEPFDAGSEGARLFHKGKLIE